MSRSARRRSACGFVMGALLGAGINCGPGEVTDVVEELPGDPYCLILAGTRGYFEDGTTLLLGDWEQSHVLGGCVCATYEEILAGERDEDMNTAGLDRCQEFAAMQDFVHDECQEDYESGEWFGSVILAEPGSGWEQLVPPYLHCAGSP